MKAQRLKIGDMVEIEVFKKGRSSKKHAVDPALLEWAEKLMKRYEPALKRLASS